MERLALFSLQALPLQALKLPTVWRRDVALFNRSDSVKLLEYMEHVSEENLSVIGIEGFKIEGEFLIPLMDYIADFSELSTLPKSAFHRESIKASRDFLKLVLSNEILLEWVIVK